MLPSSRTSVAAVALSLLMVTGRAVAQQPAPKPNPGEERARFTEAERLYEDGVRAYAAGRYQDAIDLFRDADRRAPSAALSYDMARAYVGLGDDAGALGSYREYLRRSENPDDAAEVQRTVKKLSRRLAARGIQQVTVLSTPPGATVFLDGERFGVTPATSETRPGTHTLTVRLDGYVDENRGIEVPVKEPIDVQVALQERPSPASPVPSPPVPATAPPALSGEPAASPDEASAPPEGGHSSTALNPVRTTGIIALGAGGAALGGALVFELLRRSTENEAKNEQEQVSLANEINTIHSRRTTARVLASVGGGLVAIGGTLFLVSLSSSPSGKDRGTAMKLDVTGTDLRAVLSGRF
jgi:hypothetical protein